MRKYEGSGAGQTGSGKTFTATQIVRRIGELFLADKGQRIKLKMYEVYPAQFQDVKYYNLLANDDIKEKNGSKITLRELLENDKGKDARKVFAAKCLAKYSGNKGFVQKKDGSFVLSEKKVGEPCVVPPGMKPGKPKPGNPRHFDGIEGR